MERADSKGNVEVYEIQSEVHRSSFEGSLNAIKPSSSLHVQIYSPKVSLYYDVHEDS